MTSITENNLKNLINDRVAKLEYEKEDLSQVNPQLHKSLSIINDKSSSGDSITPRPESVNSKFSFNSEGTNKHSLRSVSERQTIVDMLNSLPYEVEHNEYFAEYLTKVKELDKMQAKVDALNAEWTELSFARGKRSDETKARLAEIRKQTDALNAKITKLDRRLLDLAEFRPFRNLVKAAVKKQKAAGRESSKPDVNKKPTSKSFNAVTPIGAPRGGVAPPHLALRARATAQSRRAVH
jgi:hypothetical protein